MAVLHMLTGLGKSRPSEQPLATLFLRRSLAEPQLFVIWTQDQASVEVQSECPAYDIEVLLDC